MEEKVNLVHDVLCLLLSKLSCLFCSYFRREKHSVLPSRPCFTPKSILSSDTIHNYSFLLINNLFLKILLRSGLAVEPSTADSNGTTTNSAESIFGLAQQASPDDQATVRRTITMYRGGFVVDNGPYRRLDDPENASFLRSLARGQTPEELRGDSGGNNNTTVGLIDKRHQEYVEEFRSFSGTGQSLGSSTTATATSSSGEGSTNSVFDPSVLLSSSGMTNNATTDAAAPTTSIAVRMLDGSRKVVTIALGATVAELAARVAQASSMTLQTPFRIVAGFPPKPLEDGNQTVEDAGLKGAQVKLQKA